jgi:hypothetical protein
MTQTQVQIQTTRAPSKEEFFNTVKSLIESHAYEIAINYLNEVAKLANDPKHTIVVNPQSTGSVIATWVYEERRMFFDEPATVITVHLLYVTRIAVKFKFVFNETGLIMAGALYEKF